MKNVALDYAAVHGTVSWKLFLVVQWISWTALLVQMAWLLRRMHQSKLRARQRRGNRASKRKPAEELALLVRFCVAMQSLWTLLWLLDPKAWAGMYSVRVADGTVRCARVFSIATWLFIVLFWQELHKLAASFRMMRGYAAYWRRVLVGMMGVGVAMTLPLVGMSFAGARSYDELALWYNAIFFVYAGALAAGGVVYMRRLTDTLHGIDHEREARENNSGRAQGGSGRQDGGGGGGGGGGGAPPAARAAGEETPQQPVGGGECGGGGGGGGGNSGRGGSGRAASPTIVEEGSFCGGGSGRAASSPTIVEEQPAAAGAAAGGKAGAAKAKPSFARSLTMKLGFRTGGAGDEAARSRKFVDMISRIRCIVAWALLVVLCQLCLALWFLTSAFSDAGYVAHSFLVHQLEWVLCLAAVKAVEPRRRGARQRRGSADGGGGGGAENGGESTAFCCCLKDDGDFEELQQRAPPCCRPCVSVFFYEASEADRRELQGAEDGPRANGISMRLSAAAKAWVGRLGGSGRNVGSGRTDGSGRKGGSPSATPAAAAAAAEAVEDGRARDVGDVNAAPPSGRGSRAASGTPPPTIVTTVDSEKGAEMERALQRMRKGGAHGDVYRKHVV